MKTKILAVLLLASASAFARTRISIGVNIGGGYYPGAYYAAVPPPPPPPVYYYAPPSPGPGYLWIDGYYYPVGHRYEYRRGYWTRPPRGRSFWVAPRYHSGRYYNGYWR